MRADEGDARSRSVSPASALHGLFHNMSPRLGGRENHRKNASHQEEGEHEQEDEVQVQVHLHRPLPLYSQPINGGRGYKLLENDGRAKRAGANINHRMEISVIVLMRIGVGLAATACLLVFCIAVARKQQPAFPLKNISQYAATYPSIYIFRLGTALCSSCLFAVAYAMNQNR